jgi:hypothetical protein
MGSEAGIMDQTELLAECFRHFWGLDVSNAAIHCAPVRYSPITFRLAEVLEQYGGDAIEDVLSDKGRYSEDKGR